MLNRYVNGLATWAPPETAAYKKIGEMLAQTGYVNSLREATKGRD